MESTAKLETLVDTSEGDAINLPESLQQYYGSLRFPVYPNRPYVITNFVETLDGVVTLKVPGHEGGGDISGFNADDRTIMGLLRAAVDVVIITSASLKIQPKSIWTGSDIAPNWKPAYQQLRENLNKPSQPLHVVVTATGNVDPAHRVFSNEVPAMIITTHDGAARLQKFGFPEHVRMVVPKDFGWLSAYAILDAIKADFPEGLILVEGGPHLVGTFFGDHKMDEVFLSIAPQVAGRSDAMQRLGFVAGRVLAPDQPTWGRLVTLKKAGEMLFSRYRFEKQAE